MPQTAYLGEIIPIAFNFPPKGYALCNGQILSIQQNQALFAILGTTYGGNGVTTFALPNLQGCTPIHWGAPLGGGDFVLGQTGGEIAHTLLISELPQHIHTPVATTHTADTGQPGGAYWAGGGQQIYADAQNSTMNPAAIGIAGGSQPHSNLQPYLVINFAIALVGIFPSRN